MLDPQQRAIYLDALRPPDGYRLDRAVATTYTLDLTALLVVPLAMALFPCESGQTPLRDPMAVLEALRRNADRLTVFCQRGRIKAPSINHLLYSALESIVVEVDPTRPAGPSSTGVFHPKAWFLRFVGPDDTVRLRFLCLSRNLTFDRSWDTIFAIEGEVDTAAPPEVRNEPLARFLEALPTLAHEAVTAARRSDIERLGEELRHAKLRLPPDSPFDEGSLRFHPLGLGSEPTWPFAERSERLLVVSPFLAKTALRDLAGTAEEAQLVTRLNALRDLGRQSLVGFDSGIYVLHEAVEDEEALAPGVDAEEDPDAVSGHDGLVEDDPPLEDMAEELPGGLHAKLYVAETDGRARIWTGSANATAAALPPRRGAAGAGRSQNVELLVELAGPARSVGIDALLGGPEGGSGLLDLIVPWQLTEEDPELTDEERRLAELEGRIDRLRRTIGSAPLRLGVEATDGEDEHNLIVFVPAMFDSDAWAGVTVRCWPITRRREQALPLDAVAQREGLRFTGVATASLTRFLAIEIEASDGPRKRRTRFVLNLPIEGMPEDRDARILRTIIRDSKGFIRYLLFLLAEGDDGGSAAQDMLVHLTGDDDASAASDRPEAPLLEEMVRALARAPEKIGRIKRLVDDLQDSEDGKRHLPEGFLEIWAPIEAAWREVEEGRA